MAKLSFKFDAADFDAIDNESSSSPKAGNLLDITKDDFDAIDNEMALSKQVESRGPLGDILSGVVRGIAIEMPSLFMDTAAATERIARKAFGYEQEQEVGPIGEIAREGKKDLEAFRAEHPILRAKEKPGIIAQGVESAAMSLSSGVPGALTGFAIGSMLGPASPVTAPMLALVGFAMSGGLTFGLSEYENVIQMADEQKIDRKISEPAAIISGIAEGGFEFASDLITGGLLKVAKPLTTPAKEMLKTGIRQTFKMGFKEAAARAGAVIASETSMEMLTAGVQAEQYKKIGLGDRNFWEGAKDAMGPAFVASVIFAGVGTGATRLHRNSIRRRIENGAIDPKLRMEAAEEIGQILDKIDPDIATTWRSNANEAIKNKENIETDDPDLIRRTAFERANSGKQGLAAWGEATIQDIEAQEFIVKQEVHADKQHDIGQYILAGIATDEISEQDAHAIAKNAGLEFSDVNQSIIHGMDIRRMIEDQDAVELRNFAESNGISIPRLITNGNQMSVIVSESLKDEGSAIYDLAKQVKNLEETATKPGMERAAANLEKKKAALIRMMPAVGWEEVPSDRETKGRLAPIQPEEGFKGEAEALGGSLLKTRPSGKKRVRSSVLEIPEEIAPETPVVEPKSEPIPEVVEPEKVEGAKAGELPEGEKAGKQVEESINSEIKGLVKYDGAYESFEGYEGPEIHQFTTRENYGELPKGQTFTVKGTPTTESVKAALDRKAKEFGVKPGKFEEKPTPKPEAKPEAKGKEASGMIQFEESGRKVLGEIKQLSAKPPKGMVFVETKDGHGRYISEDIIEPVSRKLLDLRPEDESVLSILSEHNPIVRGSRAEGRNAEESDLDIIVSSLPESESKLSEAGYEISKKAWGITAKKDNHSVDIFPEKPPPSPEKTGVALEGEGGKKPKVDSRPDNRLFDVESVNARIKSVRKQRDILNEKPVKSHSSLAWDNRQDKIRALTKRESLLEKRLRDIKSGELVAPVVKEKPVKQTAKERQAEQIAKEKVDYNSSPAKEFVEDFLGDNENQYNKAALARFLDGTDNKYNGIMGWKWVESLKKMGISEDLMKEGTPKKDIVDFLKQKYQGIESKPTKAKPKMAEVEEPLYSTAEPEAKAKTDTPEFKKWFGKSKVVDENGKPMVVYHAGESIDETYPGVTFWGNDTDIVAWFGRKEGASMTPAYIKIENPYYADWEEIEYINEHKQEINDLKKRGYDGIIERNSDETENPQEPWQFVTFKPAQIKSIYNRGDFSLTDPRILYKAGEKTRTKTTANQVLDVVLPYIQGMAQFPTVRVVQSIEQLPNRLKSKVTAFSKKSNKQVEGFYDKVDDQVFLIADNLSEGRIEAVLRHEAEGHRGIRLLLGSELDGFLDGIAQVKKDELLKYDSKLNFKDQEAVRVAADEWIARKIEAGNLGKSFWDDLVRIFRKWLRKFVPNLDLTDGEIRSVLTDTVKNVREGRIDRMREGEGMPLFSKKKRGKVLPMTSKKGPGDDITTKKQPYKPEGGQRYPIKFGEKPKIGEREFNENLLVYLDEPNTDQMKDRFGKEKVGKKFENITRYDGEYGSWRYVYKNEKGENVGVIQGVSSDKTGSIISNVYVRPDFRRQGIASKILDVIDTDQIDISVDSGLSKSGAGLMGITTKQASESPMGGEDTVIIPRKEYLPNRSPEYVEYNNKVKKIWDEYNKSIEELSKPGLREAAYAKSMEDGIKYDTLTESYVRKRENAINTLGEKIPQHIEKLHYDSYSLKGIKNYDSNNDADLKQLLKKISSSDGHIGVRGIYKKEIGKKNLRQSFAWDNGNPTTEPLGGSSVLYIGESSDFETIADLKRLAEKDVSIYGNTGIKAIVFSKESLGAHEIYHDVGEVVFPNAKVIGYIDAPVIKPLPKPSSPPGEGGQDLLFSTVKDIDLSKELTDDIAFDKKRIDLSKEGISKIASHLYTKFIMQEYPVVSLAKKAGQEIAERIENQVRRLRGKGGIVEAILTADPKAFEGLKESGITEYENITKSLKGILSPLATKDMYQDYERMRVAQRDLAFAKFRPDIKGVDEEKAQKTIDLLQRKYGDDFSKLEDISSEHREFERQAILQPLVKAGWLSEDDYSKIVNKPESEYYASFLRHMEDAERQTVGSGKEVVKRIHGSEKKKIPSVEGTIANVQRTVKLVESLRLNKQVVALKDLPGFEGVFTEVKPQYRKIAGKYGVYRQSDKKEMAGDVYISRALKTFENKYDADAFAASKPDAYVIKHPDESITMPVKPFGAIVVAEDGKKTYYRVPDDIYKALDYYTPEEMSSVIKILSIPTRILRAGATLSTEFIARNPVRDQFTAMVYSKYGYNPFKDFGKGIYHLLKKTDLYNEFKAAGGEQSYFVSLDRQSTNVTARNLTGYKKEGKEKFATLNPVEALRMLSEWMEKGTRLGLYSKAKAKGATAIEAMAESREGTLDFGRIGQEKALNQIIAFWNANLQGTDKMVRSFKFNPGRTLMRTALGITLPSIILWGINHDDDRYKSLPEWQKNFFWIILTGKDGPIIRIPKPFELGVIFGSLPERILDHIFENEPGSLKSITEAIGEGASPGLIPTAALPFIEHVANYSFFRGRSLEPMSVQRRSPGMRYTSYTTDIMKSVGEMTDISPIKLENWVNVWTGTLGKTTLELMDQLYKPENIPEVGKKWYEITPAIKGFIAREPLGSSSKDVNDFYEYAQKVTEAKADYQILHKKDADESVKFYKKYGQRIRLAKQANFAIRKMASIRKRIDRVIISKSIPSDIKRRKINELNERISKIAKSFNERYIRTA